ncbi:MAG: outer membrane beta-barrel protein, partial [Chitinophagaceae bacterium]|nr:outer membrane beta-barrel protein [Chitinophagaceae bacterium]
AAEGKLSAYLNYVGGEDLSGANGNQVDAVITGKVSDKFSIGYNGTVKFVKTNDDNSDSWWASALYINVDPSPKLGLTLRGEYFDDKDNVTGAFGTSIIQTTLSFIVKPTPGLIIMPEFRLDAAKDEYFLKNSGESTKSTGSFILAAIVSF